MGKFYGWNDYEQEEKCICITCKGEFNKHLLTDDYKFCPRCGISIEREKINPRSIIKKQNRHRIYQISEKRNPNVFFVEYRNLYFPYRHLMFSDDIIESVIRNNNAKWERHRAYSYRYDIPISVYAFKSYKECFGFYDAVRIRYKDKVIAEYEITPEQAQAKYLKRMTKDYAMSGTLGPLTYY